MGFMGKNVRFVWMCVCVLLQIAGHQTNGSFFKKFSEQVLPIFLTNSRLFIFFLFVFLGVKNIQIFSFIIIYNMPNYICEYIKNKCSVYKATACLRVHFKFIVKYKLCQSKINVHHTSDSVVAIVWTIRYNYSVEID